MARTLASSWVWAIARPGEGLSRCGFGRPQAQ